MNTIVYAENGRRLGSNTDSFGFTENLRDRIPDWCATDGPAVILGAGGVARAIVVALLDSGVKQLFIVNRSYKRAKTLVSNFNSLLNVVEWSEREKVLEGAENKFLGIR